MKMKRAGDKGNRPTMQTDSTVYGAKKAANDRLLIEQSLKMVFSIKSNGQQQFCMCVWRRRLGQWMCRITVSELLFSDPRNRHTAPISIQWNLSHLLPLHSAHIQRPNEQQKPIFSLLFILSIASIIAIVSCACGAYKHTHKMRLIDDWVSYYFKYYLNFHCMRTEFQ